MPILSDENSYKILKLIANKSDFNQRQLAKKLGISLGKVNYCLKALIEMGWVMSSNFKSNQNKKTYTYLLTPKGVEEKARVTQRFFKYKQLEYASLQQELKALSCEIVQLKQTKERQ